jgi:hypothetical protein
MWIATYSLKKPTLSSLLIQKCIKSTKNATGYLITLVNLDDKKPGVYKYAPAGEHQVKAAPAPLPPQVLLVAPRVGLLPRGESSLT